MTWLHDNEDYFKDDADYKKRTEFIKKYSHKLDPGEQETLVNVFAAIADYNVNVDGDDIMFLKDYIFCDDRELVFHASFAFGCCAPKEASIFHDEIEKKQFKHCKIAVIGLGRGIRIANPDPLVY